MRESIGTSVQEDGQWSSHLPSSSKSEYKFAVGTPEVRSAIWKIKTHKQDLYIMHGVFGGVQKASRHANAWYYQWTKEFAAAHPRVLDPDNGRCIDTWPVVDLSQSSHEWTLSVIVPDSELAPRGDLGTGTPNLHWYEPPMADGADTTAFHITITADELACVMPQDESQETVKRLHTPGGLYVWILAHRYLLHEYIRDGIRDYKESVARGPIEELTTRPEFSGFAFANHEGSPRLLVDVSLVDVARQVGIKRESERMICN